jgi:hypothetical protein
VQSNNADIQREETPLGGWAKRREHACPLVHRVPAAAVRHDCVAAGKFNFAGRPRPSSRRPLAAVCGQLAVAGGHLDGLLAIINHSSINLLKTVPATIYNCFAVAALKMRVTTAWTFSWLIGNPSEAVVVFRHWIDDLPVAGFLLRPAF